MRTKILLIKGESFFLTIFLILMISGCRAIGNLVDEDINENNVEINAYFCPQYDCGEIINDMVNNAQTSVHCAFYDLDFGDLISTISKKSHFADVRILIDKNNYDGQIKGDGVKVVKPKSKMHNKFCIFDGNYVLTGSTNPTNNGFNKNNNNVLIIDSEYIAENYEEEFNELWDGIYSSGDSVKYDRIDTNVGKIENYFCPEDCNDGERVIDLIKYAEKSVKVASFSFTHGDLGDELVKSDIKGVDVYILTERRQRNVQGSQYTKLKDFGLNIKVDGNKNNMHHKFIVIDDEIVVLGSPNFSFSGFNRNDENMLIIFNQELALGYGKEFDRMFDLGEKV
jgi:phosphatidylserine/phosphatidylglycerophosphate/cardiolipin synthase-like enzyme